MSFNQVQSKLTDLFGGAAAANAETYSGRIARMQVAFDEAKETIGFALLPILEKVMTFINNNALPIINAFSSAFSLDKGGLGGVITNLGQIIVQTFQPIISGLIKAFNYVKDAIGDNLDTFKVFGSYIATYLAPVIGTVLGGALQVVGKIAGGVIDVVAGVIKVINGLIGGAIDGINALIRAYNAVPLLPNIPTISKPTLSAPSVSSGSSISGVLGGSIPAVPSVSVPTVTGGGAGLASASTSAAKAAASSYAKGSYYDPMSANTPDAKPYETPNISVVVNQGIVGDPEGAARSIVDVLNRSYGRGALGAEALFI
jgi:phage-related protein